MKAFATGIAIACLAAVGAMFAYETLSVSAVDYRADRATHVHQESANSEMGEQTRTALRRRSAQ